MRAPFLCAWGCRYALGTAYLAASHLLDFGRALASLQGEGAGLMLGPSRSKEWGVGVVSPLCASMPLV